MNYTSDSMIREIKSFDIISTLKIMMNATYGLLHASVSSLGLQPEIDFLKMIFSGRLFILSNGEITELNKDEHDISVKTSRIFTIDGIEFNLQKDRCFKVSKDCDLSLDEIEMYIRLQ